MIRSLSGFIGVNSAGEEVLNTTLLLPFVKQWYDQKLQRYMMQTPDPHGFRLSLEFRELSRALDLVARHTDKLIRFGNKDAGPQGRALFCICVFINLVWPVFRAAVTQLGRFVIGSFNNFPMPDPLGNEFPSAYPAGSELRKHIIQRGWCPNKIQNMQRPLGIEGLVMASTIQKDANVSASHARCLDHVYVANQIRWHLPLEGDSRQYCSEDAYYTENEEALTTTALAVMIDAPNFGVDHHGIELIEFTGALVANVTLEDSGIISCRYQSMVTLTKCCRKSGPMSAEDEVLHHSYGDEGLDMTGVDQAMLGTFRITKSSQSWRIM